MKKPSPEERRLGKVIDKLNDLHLKYGEDADQFIDYDALLRNRKIVEHCRRSVESSISRRYLPGFRFKSTDHARWHFRNRDSLPFWIMDVPYGEEHWASNWIRSAFVPSAKQYCFEVANALKRFDDSVIRTVTEYRDIKSSGDKSWANRASNLIQLRRSGRNLPPGPVNMEGDLMAMPPWTERIANLFPPEMLPTTSRSLHRWPNQAEGRRAARRKSAQKSGWYIDFISYFGEMRCPSGRDEEAWNKACRIYFENWKWESVPGVPAPKCTQISFDSIAPRDLWKPSAKKTPYKYDD